jgi:hypothetical protein
VAAPAQVDGAGAALGRDHSDVRTARRRPGPRPEEIATIRAEVAETTGDRRYDYVVEISTKERSDAEAADLAAAYADAGTTWWLEPVWERFYEHPGEVGPMRERIQQGPPAR